MAASYSITFFVSGASCLRTYFGVTCYVNTKVGHVKRKRKGKQKTLTTVKTNTFLWSFSHKKGLSEVPNSFVFVMLRSFSFFRSTDFL